MVNLRRGWIWYLAGLLLAVVAGVIAVWALRQAVPAEAPAKPATRPVIVAIKNLSARQIVQLDAVEARDMALELIPSGAVFRIEDAAGKFSMTEVKAGQPLLAQNLISPASGTGTNIISATNTLAALLPPDKVAIVLPATDLLSQSSDVSIGDRVDILASLAVPAPQEGEGGQVTLMNLQNISVIKVLAEAAPQQSQSVQGQQKEQERGKATGLVLAVDPQDGVTLKYFIDAGARISIDLRPPKATASFDVSPVTLNYIIDKYRITFRNR